MEKKALFTAGLAAAMTAGMTLTALAGWELHGTDWYYYIDPDHRMVINDWVWSGDIWYYLGEEGKMLTDTLIDETYYVDHNGAMTANGWQWLADERDDGSLGEYWYYFENNGEMEKSTTKEINGIEYAFDSEGRMLTGWVDLEEYTSVSLDNFSQTDMNKLKYFDENGAAVNELLYPDSLTDYDSHDYFFREGNAYSSHYKTTDLGNGYYGVKIGEYYYCFDNNGQMVTGLIQTMNGKRYFDPDTGQLRTGRVTVYDDEYWGETFCFKSNGNLTTRGTGVSGVHGGYLYSDGRAICAEEGLKYEKKTLGGKDYVVNESGKIKTSGTFTDEDGIKWKITKVSTDNYKVEKVGE